MQEIVANQKYDRVWIVESDTIPPLDALQKLLAVDADVVSGLYVLRHGSPAANVFQKMQSPTLGPLYMWDELRKVWGETIEISGGCLGCLLVKAHVLLMYHPERADLAVDMSFMDFCARREYKQMARLDVQCGHKKPDGEILWPDFTHGFRIEHAEPSQYLN